MTPWAIGRQDALAERVERKLRARGRRGGAFAFAAREHLLGGNQHEAAAGRSDGGTADLDPRDLAVRVRGLDFRKHGAGLARERARNGEPRELRVFRRHELRERLADQALGRHADQQVKGALTARCVRRAGAPVPGVPPASPARRRRPRPAHPLPAFPAGARARCCRQATQASTAASIASAQAAIVGTVISPVIPFESAARGTVNFIYIARPWAAYPTLEPRPAAIHHNGDGRQN